MIRSTQGSRALENAARCRTHPARHRHHGWPGVSIVLDDGLVILDVGNGIKGGSPTHPQLVSQLTYDLNDLYRSVEAEGGPGYIRGTHTAWRQRNGHYGLRRRRGLLEQADWHRHPGERLGKANGRLHVIDVADIAHSREVALV